jgi:Flp pilus assembly CpaF family ATPase
LLKRFKCWPEQASIMEAGALDWHRKKGEFPGSVDEEPGHGSEDRLKQDKKSPGQNSEDDGFGWNTLERPKTAIVLEEGECFLIAKMLNGEKRYCVKGFPVLTLEEKALLGKLMGLFQKRPGKGKREELEGFVKLYCLQNLVLLSKEQLRYMVSFLESQLFGFGPFDLLLQDGSIEEIAVIGVGREKPIFVFHRKHGWLSTNIFISSADYARDLANKMARSIGRRLSMNSPVLNATLPDGSRLNAAINPISFSGPSITIRKFRKQPFTPKQLLENQTFSAELMAFLWIAMECDCSILIVGNTGSGKTSSLNALLSFVPGNERIVLVEETPEIRVQHRHFVKLNVAKEQDVGMESLIVESLRMRPDRIIVGEVRSREEVAAFVDTMLAGQGKGSYATFHGQSAKEAMNRLSSLGSLEQDLATIDLVLVQRRWNKIGEQGSREIRRVTEAAEICDGKGEPGIRNHGEGSLCLNQLFKFDYGKDRLLGCGESSRVFEKAARSFCFDRKGFSKEIGRRKRALEKCSGGESMEQFFNRLNSKEGNEK